jgi:hypothetical protein
LNTGSEVIGFAVKKADFRRVEPVSGSAHYPPATKQARTMLVERGLQVMNVEVVGDAYAIASNYLRKAGAIPDTIATDDRLLAIIVNLFQQGEFNRIRLANTAIAKFEATIPA